MRTATARDRTGTVAAVGLGAAVGWNIANVGAVAGPLSHDYGVGLATIGLFTTALFVVHMCMQIPGGKAADRFGARNSGLLAAALIAGANAVALIAPEPAIGLTARALCGFGTGLGFVAGSDYIRARGGSALLQGVYGGASVGAPGLALAVVPQLEPWLGFRAPFLASIAIALAVLALLALSPSGPRVERQGGSLSVGLFRDRRLYPFAVAHASSFGLSVIVGNWVVTLLVRDGHGKTAAGLAGALTLLLGFFTRALGGLLVRGRPGRGYALFAWSSVAAAAATVVLGSPLPFTLLVGAAGIVGLAAGIPFAPAFAGAAAARPDAPGAAIGFINLWAALTILAGTPLLGLSFSLPGGGRAGFVVVGVLWALAVAAAPRRAWGYAAAGAPPR